MVLDARDKKITLGDYVRYVDTGTIGGVIDTRTRDGIDWMMAMMKLILKH